MGQGAGGKVERERWMLLSLEHLMKFTGKVNLHVKWLLKFHTLEQSIQLIIEA